VSLIGEALGMKQGEYSRLKRMLNDVAEKQKTVAANMRRAERRFAVVEKRIADLLNAIKKRRWRT